MSRFRQFGKVFSKSVARKTPNDWKVILLCLLAATFIWLLNALNKDYTAKIAYPLTIEYDPTQVVPVAELPQSVRINVSGYGWNLFKKTLFFNVEPLVFSPDNLPESRFVTGTQLFPLINEQIRDLQLNYVAQDTLSFFFDAYASRRVLVSVDSASLQLAGNFRRVSAIQITPDSLRLTGAASRVDSISDPVFVRLPEEAIDDDYDEAIDVLGFEDSDVLRLSPGRVRVRFDVAEFVPQSYRVPITFVNLLRDSTYAFSDTSTAVLFSYNKEEVPAFAPDSFQVVADCRRLKGDSTTTVALQIVSRPAAAYDVTIYPDQIRAYVRPDSVRTP